jgi:excisionase family DNA binding protein
MSENQGSTIPTLALNYRSAAKAVGLSERTLRQAVKRGELRAARVGRAVRFSPRDLESWLENRKG